MDGSTFDRLTRAVSSVSSRRRLLGLLTTLGLSGLLTHLDDESTEAKRKRHGRRRGHRPGKRKDNRKGKRKRGKGGGGLGNPGPCTADGRACQQNDDCCGGNCFNQVCADPVTACGGAACPAGATGCCTGTCCQGPTNQCNALGECCAPDCAGKQCGPDGCGNTGACGTCSGDVTCEESSGKCLCTAENCPNGCCSNGPGNPGTCESGETFQQCGAHCAHCANTQTCQSQQCVACAQGSCTCSGQSACLTPEAPNAYCTADESCYCAVTTAGVPVCASGATTVSGGCQTDQDCVNAFAGAYCLNPANNVDPENPCFFGQSFCGGACNP